MSLALAIAGLPNVGKSTLFNALTKAQTAQAANYPFCTIEPNKATVLVPDIRITKLSEKYQPRKTTYANVDFIDIAGLVRGASKGEGLGNQFLANIRECAAIIQVVRCFEDANITHVDGQIDPLRDIATIETEFLLADLQSLEKRYEKAQKMSKGKADAKPTLDALKELIDFLNQGKLAREFNLPDNEAFLQIWRELGLLTAKPMIYCANVDDANAVNGNALSAKVEEYAREHQAGFVCVCARLEEEVQGLDEAEQLEMLSAYGLKESGLDLIIRSGYALLGLCSYFTVGPDEVRAWTIKQGCKAPQAAGEIHSDFERGFIRAEVMSYQDCLKYPNEAAARAAACLRTEGKDYIVNDGDVIHFLFNV